MIRAAVPLLLGLLCTNAASGAEGPGCSVRKGLYDGWLGLSRKSNSRAAAKDALLAAGTGAVNDPEGRQEIKSEYQAFFQCLSDTAERKDESAVQAVCDENSGDRLAAVVCQTAVYVKGGRTRGQEFVDAVPSGRKGAEMIWDLEAIAVSGPKAKRPLLFLPQGPAYKLIDELFVLVLDDKENAAAKYFGIAAYAADEGVRHTDAQIMVLMREAPAVVVKEWAVVRQYQPRLKKLLAEMSATLSRAEMKKMRQGIAGFCTKDNLDCPEILRVFGRPE